MPSALRGHLITALSIGLSIFVLIEVNYAQLSPQSQLALFALFGLVLCFMLYPTKKPERFGKVIDVSCALASAFVCLYVVVQTEPRFESIWTSGLSLGDRAGAESPLDYLVGGLGVVLVLVATLRCL